MIKRDKKKGNLSLDNASHYEYRASKFFDSMNGEFRIDLEEWTKLEILKNL